MVLLAGFGISANLNYSVFNESGVFGNGEELKKPRLLQGTRKILING